MAQQDDRPDAPADQPTSDDPLKTQRISGPMILGNAPPTAQPGLPLLRLGPEHTAADPATPKVEAPTPPVPEPPTQRPEADLTDNTGADRAKDVSDAAAPILPKSDETKAEALPTEPALQSDLAPQTEAAITATDSADTPPPETSPAPDADPWSVLQDTAPPAEAETALEPQTPAPAMSAVQRPACAAALFGKLPTRGDFIARNMPRLLQRPFEDWLIPLVQQTRSELGTHWAEHWRNAGPWRFWIGPDVLGGSWQRDLRKPAHEQDTQGGAVTGVLLPSADRHGRDFPLVVLLADSLARLMPPPVTASPDRDWYDLCDELLYAARAGTEIGAVEAALDTLPGPLLPDGAEDMTALLGQRALWAQGTEVLANGTSRIWRDIATADHHLAASSRSYWWQAPRAGAAQRVLSLAGLPDAGSFAFMLAQGHPDAPAPPT